MLWALRSVQHLAQAASKGLVSKQLQVLAPAVPGRASLSTGQAQGNIQSLWSRRSISSPGRIQAGSSMSFAARPLATSERMAAAHGEGGGIYNFSRDEDPESAEKVAWTLGEAMGSLQESSLFCPKPEWGSKRFHAIGHNYTLGSMSKVRMLYAISKDDFRAVGYAYWYPEESGEDPPEGGPPQDGSIDITPWQRPESLKAYDELLAFLDEGKQAFYKEKGPFLHLAFLSTLPSAQGLGLGSKLLKHLTAKADAAGKWAFLEATNDLNAKLYERYGFRRIEGGHKAWTLPEVPGVTMELIRMGRPPAAQP